jgi:hypothetical protein
VSGEAAVRVSSYRLVLPPPWSRIPLRDGTEEVVHGIVERVAATTPKHVPPDQVGPRKRELARTMLQQASALRDKGGIDLYLPLDTIRGFSARTTFSVSETLPPGADPGEWADVLAVLAGETGAERVVTAGDERSGAPPTEWVRRERIVPGEEERDPAILVDYTTAVPGAEHVWLVASFSIVGSDAEDPEGTARPFVELFDAIMTTWRWVVAQ